MEKPIHMMVTNFPSSGLICLLALAETLADDVFKVYLRSPGRCQGERVPGP
jgi:hypothetical protein